MKRGVYFLIAMLFVLGGAASAFAITADTTHKGSLLIYPKIDMTRTSTGGAHTDTFITLSNDGGANVGIECYWVNGATQAHTDFGFNLTAYQPYVFSASGGGFNGTTETSAYPYGSQGFSTPVGFLACYATIPNTVTPAAWNYLYGTAWVIDYVDNVAYSYPAWSFRVFSTATGSVPVAISPGTPPSNGTTETQFSLPLDGVTYSSCPAQLAFNFPLETGSGVGPFPAANDLTIIPCKQDLREAFTKTVTKLRFDVWGTFETKYSNAYSCANCFWDNFLNSSNINYNAAFTAAQENGGSIVANLLSSIGRFRVTAIGDTATCPGSAPASIIGLLVSYVDPVGPTFAFTDRKSVV